MKSLSYSWDRNTQTKKEEAKKTNCLSIPDHFAGVPLKGLNIEN